MSFSIDFLDVLTTVEFGSSLKCKEEIYSGNKTLEKLNVLPN